MANSGNKNEWIGKTVEGYKILRYIDSGQYSSVYQAEKNGEHCALKVVNIFDLMNEQERTKCLGEVKLLQSLTHPGIIRYFDSFIAENRLFISIEWADKGDLKKLIRKHEQEKEKIEENKIYEYLKNLASALEQMHSQRIMHRDLKPANILYFSDGVKLSDLGLSKLVSDTTMYAYSTVGTPLYMAPEVIVKEKGYDFKSDNWSLGCVLYEMITFKSPFRVDQKINMQQLFFKILHADYKKLTDNDCSPNLRKIVEGLLQIDPIKRIELTTVNF